MHLLRNFPVARRSGWSRFSLSELRRRYTLNSCAIGQIGSGTHLLSLTSCVTLGSRAFACKTVRIFILYLGIHEDYCDRDTETESWKLNDWSNQNRYQLDWKYYITVYRNNDTIFFNIFYYTKNYDIQIYTVYTVMLRFLLYITWEKIHSACKCNHRSSPGCESAVNNWCLANRWISCHKLRNQTTGVRVRHLMNQSAGMLNNSSFGKPWLWIGCQIIRDYENELFEASYHESWI